MSLREDFTLELEEMIEAFNVDPGISDEEIVDVLLAKVRAIREGIRRREGNDGQDRDDTVCSGGVLRHEHVAGRDPGGDGSVKP